MGSPKVSDLDLLRTILELQDGGVASSAPNVAVELGLVRSGVYRRLDRLVKDDVLRLVDGEFHLKPHALRIAGELREGTTTMFWQSTPEGLFITQVEERV